MSKRNFLLFIHAYWCHLLALPFLLFSSYISTCGSCKAVLNTNVGATKLRTGLCWKCCYKQMGGTTPRLPRLSDFSIVQKVQKIVVRDRDWSRQQIHVALLRNGEMIESALRRFGPESSLSADERNIIFYSRRVAEEYGMTKRSIENTEWDGRMKFRERFRDHSWFY